MSDLISLIDDRVERAIRAQPRKTYGVVATVDIVARLATVYVSGEATASAGFSYSVEPAVGATVRVVIDPRGDRYIDAVVGPVSSVVPGMITAYGGATAPAGYLLCQGQSLLRASYPELFTAIGVAYGTADGTHFTLPNLQGRFPVGKTAAGGTSTLGATGGAINHTHAHATTHSHLQAIRVIAGTTLGWNGSLGASSTDTATFTTTSAAVSNSQQLTEPIGPGTSDAADPPYQVINYIIKT